MKKDISYKPKTWYWKYTYWKSYKYYFGVIWISLIILFAWNSFVLEANLYLLIWTIILWMIVHVHIILLLLKSIWDWWPTSKRAWTTWYRNEYTDIIGLIIFIFPVFLWMNLITLKSIFLDIEEKPNKIFTYNNEYDINCDFSFWSIVNWTFIYYLNNNHFCLIQKKWNEVFFLENYKYIWNPDDIKIGDTYQYYKHSKLLIPNK